MEVAKAFAFCCPLVLHIDHFVIDFLVTIIIEPFLFLYLSLQLLNFVFVLLKFFLGLSFNVGALLPNVVAESLDLCLNFISSFLLN